VRDKCARQVCETKCARQVRKDAGGQKGTSHMAHVVGLSLEADNLKPTRK